MPEVSVVIPAYNRAILISSALGSVLEQTFEDYEVIVVDDGSADGTAEAVLTHDDPRITLCRHENNKGLSAARNTGIARASGRYVAFLDTDDLWRPTRLERQINAMRTHKWPACCTWYSTKKFNDPEEPRRIKQRADWFWTLLFLNPVGGGSNLTVERVWFDRVGPYDETLPYAEDIDWLLRFCRHVNLGILEEDLLVTRRCDEGSTWWGGDNPYARYCELWMTQTGGRPRLNRQERRRFKAGIAAGRAGIFIQRGNYAKAMRYLGRAAMLSPAAVAARFIVRAARIWPQLTRYLHY